jgi:hypothetical protein
MGEPEPMLFTLTPSSTVHMSGDAEYIIRVHGRPGIIDSVLLSSQGQANLARARAEKG